jgi:acetylornithine deacetylase/succinyl-diaminopimelate desuccinylase-like protein
MKNDRSYKNYGNFSERVELKPVLTSLANATSLTAHERDLAALLSISRAAGGPGESYLVTRLGWLAENTNADLVVDDYGNIFLTILTLDGGVPALMWTSHTDSVASRGEPYNSELGVYERDGSRILGLTTPNNGTSCLGADCGTGVWLMMAMINAKKPGRYAFFRDEETGCEGSKWAADNTPERFKGVVHAIAFDRAGTTDIITSQHGSRCASEAFATSLSQILCATSGGKINLHSAVGVHRHRCARFTCAGMLEHKRRLQPTAHRE